MRAAAEGLPYDFGALLQPLESLMARLLARLMRRIVGKRPCFHIYMIYYAGARSRKILRSHYFELPP